MVLIRRELGSRLLSEPLKNDLLMQAVDSAHKTIDENQAVPQNVTSGNFSLASSRLLPLPSSCQ